MVKLQTALFPAKSSYTYSTLVIPSGKNAPDVWDCDISDTDPELSVIVGSCQFIVAPPIPTSISSTIFLGQSVLTGGTVSTAAKNICLKKNEMIG